MLPVLVHYLTQRIIEDGEKKNWGDWADLQEKKEGWEERRKKKEKLLITSNKRDSLYKRRRRTCRWLQACRLNCSLIRTEYWSTILSNRGNTRGFTKRTCQYFRPSQSRILQLAVDGSITKNKSGKEWRKKKEGKEGEEGGKEGRKVRNKELFLFSLPLFGSIARTHISLKVLFSFFPFPSSFRW